MFALMATLSMGFASAQAQQAGNSGFSASGLNYCAPPSQPGCIGLAASYATATGIAACTAQFNQYIDSVFVYRTCLDHEVKRVVSEANALSQSFKCRSAGRRNCK